MICLSVRRVQTTCKTYLGVNLFIPIHVTKYRIIQRKRRNFQGKIPLNNKKKIIEFTVQISSRESREYKTSAFDKMVADIYYVNTYG